MPSFIRQATGGLGISMKNNKTAITILLLFVTVVLLGSTIYISTLLSSTTNSPTQIQKTRASAITYKKTIELTDFGTEDPTGEPSPGVSPSATPTPTTALIAKAPTSAPTAKPTTALIAKAPTLAPTVAPITKTPTAVPTMPAVAALEPTDIPEVVTPPAQPLLAYKSTTLTPTLIPIKGSTGGMLNPTVAKSTPTPTKAALVPTGVQQLPETGWVQTSSILFIVAATTILFSLLF